MNKFYTRMLPGLLIVVAAGLGLWKASAQNNTSSGNAPGVASFDQQEWHAPPRTRSMVALIGSPEKFQNKPVQTYGYLSIDQNNQTLFLHEEDKENYLFINSLDLHSIPDNMIERVRQYNNSYVLVEGVFDSGNRYPLLENSGFIYDIKRIEPWVRNKKPNKD